MKSFRYQILVFKICDHSMCCFWKNKYAILSPTTPFRRILNKWNSFRIIQFSLEFRYIMSPRIAKLWMPYKERTVIQYSSVAQSCPTICNPITCSMPGLPVITNSQNPPKPMSIVSVIPSNHLILCCPLLLPSSIFSSIRVFSNKSVLCIRWPKYWSFSFNITPSSEYLGLISFAMDWWDLLAV